ncbi:MAG: hypothetical protein A2887_05460 [Alphaproteobacteria bacterium RIFCSPLOWO2_01_FULL_40_26]|nr:MAG: hypothetical protein A3D15_05915 [Alphaproteobacteria bacterium RIFCSPHIGHO2_02_FULL_40_34]OFW85740.1 MAG: hypothetical protein A2794_00740 [Alphaproteobacteria bacterium RIFCSPHIGHO2_01_FULL_40_8]OFW94179.1 MAG: hypothetical protein A2887_05460 [Alphaproteobacteria bacterium RIFCSPLOWO2_01_FULL_40_26]OFX09748.1 MAG: hypothetical protein A3H30_00220 [Alphaproteobacteria bacterium RIFCSPLOWO2_02_FULL_40_19]OFX11456.1 MAG: hypothetical protein A3G22_02085 [Alphaproteobacteria bacterium RI
MSKITYNFMSVIAPEGDGKLQFKFEPKLFLFLFKVSKAVMLLYLSAVFCFMIRPFCRKYF